MTDTSSQPKSSTRTIWKFPIFPDQFTTRMPKDAEILSVQVQNGEPQMWVMVDPKADGEPRTFLMAGTGHTLPDGLTLTHLGTFQLAGGSLVFHVFEVVS